MRIAELSAARFAYNWPDATTRQMHTALLAAQRRLLWHAGTREDNVARMMWTRADADCAQPPPEEDRSV